VRRAFEAFVKGGWLGVGLGKAETKLTGLPVPPTDSIFAVVGEETGVLGALALVGLYITLLWRGLTISRRAPDQMGALLAAGLSLWIAWEAFVNMAVMVNLLPFAGNALPLISAGGSSMVVTMASIGILMNISRLSEKRKEDDGKLFHAVVSLRGRDRRRSVSGAGRASSATGRTTGHSK
jgi:cell division protein FtsW